MAFILTHHRDCFPLATTAHARVMASGRCWFWRQRCHIPNLGQGATQTTVWLLVLWPSCLLLFSKNRSSKAKNQDIHQTSSTLMSDMRLKTLSESWWLAALAPLVMREWQRSWARGWEIHQDWYSAIFSMCQTVVRTMGRH